MGVLELERPVHQANIFDPVHDELDQQVFKGDTPRPLLVSFIHRKIFACLRDGFIDDPEKYFKLYLTGSLTTYQYSDASDCDISVFPDYEALTKETGEEDPQQVRKMLILLITTELDGTDLPGTPHPLQNFVQQVGATPSSSFAPGIRAAWDFQTHSWFVPPEKERSHDPIKEFPELFQKAQAVGEKMQILLDHGEIEAARQLYKDVHAKRAEDPSDYSEGNLEYKWLSHKGLFDRLRDEAGMHIAKTAKGSEDTEPIGKDVGFLGEPHDTLYPPLFKGMKLRPEVGRILKEHALEAIAEEFENPDDFCYFTIYGSGISYNWDEKGDVDIQIWVDIDEYHGEPKTQDDLVADVRRLIAPINFASVKELGINTQDLPGTTLIQYYAKPGTGSKDENLASKPYACYDLETNKWLVRPTKIKPDFYGDAFLKMLPEANDVANEAESLLDDFERHVLEWEFWQQLDEEEPHEEYKTRATELKDKAEQEQEGITRIFQRIFKGRADAYSPGGEGLNDQRDILQKYLEIWGLFQRLKMDARKALPWKDASWRLAEAPMENPISYQYYPLTDAEMRQGQTASHLFGLQAKGFNNRADKSGAGGRVSPTELAAMMNRYEGTCAYCGQPGAESFDHVVPLSRGGTGDISNLLPAHIKCNSELGTWDHDLEHPYGAGSAITVSPKWREVPAVLSAKKEEDSSDKMKIIYDFNNDSIMLGDSVAKDKPGRDGVIIGEYSDGTVKLFDVAKQWVNANYFKRLWVNSFPTRPINKVFFDKSEIPTRPTHQMTYTQKLPHLTSKTLSPQESDLYNNHVQNLAAQYSTDERPIYAIPHDHGWDSDLSSNTPFSVYNLVQYPKIQTETDYLTALHELGHAVHGHTRAEQPGPVTSPEGQQWLSDIQNKERQAWDWALGNSLVNPNPQTMHDAYQGYCSYYGPNTNLSPSPYKGDEPQLALTASDTYHDGSKWKHYLRNRGVIADFKIADGTVLEGKVIDYSESTLKIEVAGGGEREFDSDFLKQIKFKLLDKRTLSKAAAGSWDTGTPRNGTFGFINGHLILGQVHHKAIISQLLNAGWTWDQLMNAEQAWGWFNTGSLSSGPTKVKVDFVSDSGYQNEKAQEDALIAFQNRYDMPAEKTPYSGRGIESEDDYGTGLGNQKAKPGDYSKWVEEVPGPPGEITAAYLDEVFSHGVYKYASDNSYWKEQGLPDSGAFGYVAGHLMLADTHHQAIMGNLINAGWTWEQLMEAEQSWGWFTVDYDYDEDEDEEHKYIVDLNFVSDSGTMNDSAIEGAVQEFEKLYRLPVRKGVSGGVSNPSSYGTGLSGQKKDKGYGTDLELGEVPPPPEMHDNPGKQQQLFDPKTTLPTPPKATPGTYKGDGYTVEVTPDWKATWAYDNGQTSVGPYSLPEYKVQEFINNGTWKKVE